MLRSLNSTELGEYLRVETDYLIKNSIEIFKTKNE